MKMPKVLLLAGLAGFALAAGVARAEDTPPAAAPAAPAAPEPDYTLAFKLALYSEYEYRGISQTSEKPAGQLNIDFTHKSGFYIGTFL
ncbi:MAG TPA: TorF family putative porin, partial [Usitatibacter sp.]|nr:TorF family putative porin [Usitatibacter sp.]